MNGQLQHLTFYYDLFGRIIFITPVHWSYLHSSFMTCIAQSSHSSLVLGGGEFIHHFLRIGKEWTSGKNTQGTRKWTCSMGDTFSNGPCSYYCASLPECIPYHHMLLCPSPSTAMRVNMLLLRGLRVRWKNRRKSFTRDQTKIKCFKMSQRRKHTLQTSLI